MFSILALIKQQCQKIDFVLLFLNFNYKIYRKILKGEKIKWQQQSNHYTTE